MREADPDRRRAAADLLVRAYRAPLLAVLAWRWRLEPADAEDLVQEFFTVALEKRWFEQFDATRSRFRTFLRVIAGRFAAKARESSDAQKRGGAATILSLDELADALPGAEAESEQRFRQEWIRSIITLALAALREEAIARDRLTHIALFEAYDIDDPIETDRPTYATLARQHALSETQVINHLAWARRRFRSHVLGILRQLAGSDAEYREDVRELLGIEAP